MDQAVAGILVVICLELCNHIECKLFEPRSMVSRGSATRRLRIRHAAVGQELQVSTALLMTVSADSPAVHQKAGRRLATKVVVHFPDATSHFARSSAWSCTSSRMM
jgi:hypothetical protein